MAKKLELTPKIRELIHSATDGAVDPEKVSVYETIAINTKPVTKNNLFENAVHTGGTLREMALTVSQRPTTAHVPMHTNHEQGYELPVGKVFYGEVIPSGDGHEELRSLFYLPNTEVDLINKLEGGAIEEVSVGVRYKHLNCSECGWDFLGEDSDPWENLYERRCKNDHAIGKNGVHLKLNGLDRWMEMSLVSIGAANGAKIVSRTKSLLGEDQYNALAASGRKPELTTLYASLPIPENNDMDLKDLMESVKTLTASETRTKIELENAQKENATLKAAADKVTTLEATITDLQKQLADAKAGEVATLKQEKEAAFSFVRKEADRLCVAAGEAKLSDTATLADLEASIVKNRTKLSESIPTGGVTTQKQVEVAAPTSAYKTARN